MRGRGRGGEGNDRLGVQREPVAFERVEHHPRLVHLLVAAHHAEVRGLVDLDAIATTILGCAASGLGRRQRVLELAAARQACDAKARGDPRTAAAYLKPRDRLARTFGPLARLGKGVIEEHRRVAVPGQTAGDAAVSCQQRLPEPADRTNHFIAGAKSRDFVDGVELVEIRIHDADDVDAFGAKRDFRLQVRSTQQAGVPGAAAGKEFLYTRRRVGQLGGVFRREDRLFVGTKRREHSDRLVLAQHRAQQDPVRQHRSAALQPGAIEDLRDIAFLRHWPEHLSRERIDRGDFRGGWCGADDFGKQRRRVQHHVRTLQIGRERPKDVLCRFHANAESGSPGPRQGLAPASAGVRPHAAQSVQCSSCPPAPAAHRCVRHISRQPKHMRPALCEARSMGCRQKPQKNENPADITGRN